MGEVEQNIFIAECNSQTNWVRPGAGWNSFANFFRDSGDLKSLGGFIGQIISFHEVTGDAVPTARLFTEAIQPPLSPIEEQWVNEGMEQRAFVAIPEGAQA